MKAIDTVMKPLQTLKFRIKHRYGTSVDYDKLLEDQAEISFKAGIREVVEAIKGMFVGSTWGTDVIKIDGKEWQAWLKERGIDEPT